MTMLQFATVVYWASCLLIAIIVLFYSQQFLSNITGFVITVAILAGFYFSNRYIENHTPKPLDYHWLIHSKAESWKGLF